MLHRMVSFCVRTNIGGGFLEEPSFLLHRNSPSYYTLHSVYAPMISGGFLEEQSFLRQLAGHVVIKEEEHLHRVLGLAFWV